jgi:hypothetical protein
MTKRTRRFLVVGVAILVVGLGTGLVASYVGVDGLPQFGTPGPAELAYVPADTRVVAYANVRDVMESELRQKLLTNLHPQGQGADQFQQETGIDIQRDVNEVVVSMTGTGENQRPLILARGVFDTGRIEAAIRAKGGEVADYRGERLITLGNELGVAFVEADLAAVGSPADVKRAIDTKADGPNVTSNAEVMRLVKDIDTGNTWAVVNFEAFTGGLPLPADVSKQLPPISWFAASGHINGGVTALLHAETKDDASANNLRDVIRGFVALARLQMGQRPEFADLLNSFELGGEGKTVTLGFSVPPEMLDALGTMHAQRQRAPGQAPGAPRRQLPPSL